MQVISFKSSQTETTSPKQAELFVSPSQLRAWKECPKKHDYIYHKNLKTKRRQVFFDKGNYTHELMHYYYQMLQAGKLAVGSDHLVTAMIFKIKQDIEQHVASGNVETYNSVMKLMSRYITIQSPKIDKGMNIRGIEHEFRLPTGMMHEGRPVVFFGFADLIYRTLRGDYVIRDHKTGSNPRRWNKEAVEANFQLLCYGSWFYKLYNAVPKVEVNFCNTYEYKKGPSESQFSLYSHTHTEEVYRKFYAETLQLTSDMLQSSPTPHYDDGCTSCAFHEPCFLERRGVSVENLIEANYEIVDRSGITRPTPFTQDNANGN